MLGIILSSIGTFFGEIADSVGKKSVVAREQSVYTFGVLQLFGGWAMLVTLVLVKRDLFVFSAASLPTFFLRLALEIPQHYAMFISVVRAQRSTYSFVRVGTLPLLLIADLLLGYDLRQTQILGIALIVLCLILVFMGRQFSRQGIGLVLFSTVNAVFTVSLLKYNISHFNSVAAEQIMIQGSLLLFFIILAFTLGRENPFRLITKPVFSGQTASVGLATVLESFAYNYAPASIIMTAKRASAVFWATLAGNLYFQERHFLYKLGVFVLLAAGIVLLLV